MEGGPDEYPTRDEVVEYFRKYEELYELPVKRPVDVRAVRRSEAGDEFIVETDGGDFMARAVVSATGTLRSPHVPEYPGRRVFGGRQLHSSGYRRPEEFSGERVLVVGGGNSGAQIMAEVSRYADAAWVAPEEPKFLPDDVDGRVLFERATEKYKARIEGRPEPPAASLADIVVVPPVKEARDGGRLQSVRPFERFTEDGVVWPDGSEEKVDAVVWATGFGTALSHLEPLGVVDGHGRVEVEGTRSVEEPRLWLVGYGDWTGFASATVIGVGRTARDTAREIEAALETETPEAKSSEAKARASPGWEVPRVGNEERFPNAPDYEPNVTEVRVVQRTNEGEKIMEQKTQLPQAGAESPEVVVSVYDPAMCCSSGVCGPGVDPELMEVSRDLQWLSSQGVAVERFNLSQEPDAFVKNPRVSGLMQAFGDGALPAVLVGGEAHSHGKYPSRDELAEAVKVAKEAGKAGGPSEATESGGSCCGPDSGCC